jgi:hypothetical protein
VKWNRKKKTITTNAILWGFTKEETSKAIESIQNEIAILDTQIVELWESTDMEKYLERLPGILWKLHELASKVLSQEDYEQVREDIKNS